MDEPSIDPRKTALHNAANIKVNVLFETTLTLTLSGELEVVLVIDAAAVGEDKPPPALEFDKSG